jgi:hypothetical protein
MQRVTCNLLSCFKCNISAIQYLLFTAILNVTKSLLVTTKSHKLHSRTETPLRLLL